MAYVAGQDDEEDLYGAKAGGETPQASVSSAPTGAAPKAPKGGGFLDIRRLMNANQGAGSQLAQRALAQADSAASRARGALQTAQGKFQQQVQAGTPSGFNPSAPAPAAPAMPKVAAGTQPLAAPVRSPVGVRAASGATQVVTPPPPTPLPTEAVSTADRTRANEASTAGYGGPNTVQDTGKAFQDAESAYLNAIRAAENIGRPGTLGSRGGAGALDSLVAASGLQGASRRFNGLRSEIEKAANDRSLSDAARARAKETAGAAKQYLSAADKAQARLDTRRQDLQNASDGRKAADEDLYAWLMDPSNTVLRTVGMGIRPDLGAPGGTAGEDEWRRWFEGNKDKVGALRARTGG